MELGLVSKPYTPAWPIYDAQYFLGEICQAVYCSGHSIILRGFMKII